MRSPAGAPRTRAPGLSRPRAGRRHLIGALLAAILSGCAHASHTVSPYRDDPAAALPLHWRWGYGWGFPHGYAHDAARPMAERHGPSRKDGVEQ